MTNAEGCVSFGDKAIVRSHLLDLESDEYNWRGYVRTDNELEELERSLLGLGVSFKVTNFRHADQESLDEPAKREYDLEPNAASYLPGTMHLEIIYKCGLVSVKQSKVPSFFKFVAVIYPCLQLGCKETT